MELDPAVVYFTFSRIRPCFSCGRTIESTLQQFLRHELTPRDLPLLAVFTDGAHYYSQNNRRLYLYKQLRACGELATVPVRLRPLPSTKRMASKYTPEKCALEATLMRAGGGSGGGGASAEPDEASGSDHDDDTVGEIEKSGPAAAESASCQLTQRGKGNPKANQTTQRGPQPSTRTVPSVQEEPEDAHCDAPAEAKGAPATTTEMSATQLKRLKRQGKKAGKQGVPAPKPSLSGRRGDTVSSPSSSRAGDDDDDEEPCSALEAELRRLQLR